MPRRSAVLTWLWLGWADLFFGLFSALLLSFGAVLAACVLSFGAASVCLVGNLRTLPYIMLPEMPCWCGAILGLSLLALCVLSVVGCIWFFAFVRQRTTALIALLLFAVCFVLAFAVCALSAGSFQFWHVWGWFGYGA